MAAKVSQCEIGVYAACHVERGECNDQEQRDGEHLSGRGTLFPAPCRRVGVLTAVLGLL